jgi:hypothetical protein
MAEFFRKDDGSRYHRAGQGTPPGFIDAGDRGDTDGAEFSFMPETTATVHCHTP